MIALIVTLLIDTSVVKINDLIDKYFIPIQSKLILFSVNSLLCLLLQFFIINYIQRSFKRDRLNKTLNVKAFYIISLTSLCVLGTLIGFLIFQLFYHNYYDTSICIFIITISYGIATAFIIWLSLLFFSWYKSNHNLIVFLYFMSMVVIAFNLITTAAFTSVKLTDRPDRIGEYIGSSGDTSGGRHLFLDNIVQNLFTLCHFSVYGLQQLS